MMAGGPAPLQPGLGSTSPSSQTPAASQHSGQRLLWRPEESAITAPVAPSGSRSDEQAALLFPDAPSICSASEDDAGGSSRHSGSLLGSHSSSHVSSEVSSGVSSTVASGLSRASCSISATGQAAEVQSSVQFVRLNEADGGSNSRCHSRSGSSSVSSQSSLRSSAASIPSIATVSDDGGIISTASCSKDGSIGSSRQSGSSVHSSRPQRTGSLSGGSDASCVLSATTSPLSESPQSPHSMSPLAADILHGSGTLAGAANAVTDQGGGSGGASDAACEPGVRLLGAQLQPPLRLLAATAAEQLEGDADGATSKSCAQMLSRAEVSSNAAGETAHLQSDAAPIAAAEPAVAAPMHGSEVQSGALYEPLSSVDTDHGSQQPAAATPPEHDGSQLPALPQIDGSVAVSLSDLYQITPPPPPQQQQSVSAVDALLLDIPAVTLTSVPGLQLGSPGDAAESTVQTAGDEL